MKSGALLFHLRQKVAETTMKHVLDFPYFTDLKQVVPVNQSQTASSVTLTLVSVEIYGVYGFVLTFNALSRSPSTLADRAGRGYMQAGVVDQTGKVYRGYPTRIDGIVARDLYRGRAVMTCMPQLLDPQGDLTITVDAIEWEFLDDDGTQPSSETFQGPWVFDVSL